MKRCPDCGRTYTNNTLVDCLNDGTPLVEGVPDTVSFYGAPPPSNESLPSAYPESEPLDEDEYLYGEEKSPAPAYPEAPPPYAAPLPNYAAPLPNYAAPPVTAQAPSPYFSSVQKSGPRVPWRGIAFVCFFIFAIARVGLHMAQNRQNASQSLVGGTTAPGTPDTMEPRIPDTTADLFPGLKLDKTLTATPDSALRASLIAAIKKSDAADAKAAQTLNLAPLHLIYTGPALASELDTVQELKKAGTTKESRLVEQKFHTFQVNPAHTKAEVDEIENWSTVVRSKATGKVISKDPVHLDPQIVSLKRTSKGWMVENTQYYGLQ